MTATSPMATRPRASSPSLAPTSMCRSLISATFLRSSSLSRWMGFLPTTPGRGPSRVTTSTRWPTRICASQPPTPVNHSIPSSSMWVTIRPISSMWPTTATSGPSAVPSTRATLEPMTSPATFSEKRPAASRQTRAAGCSYPEGPGVVSSVRRISGIAMARKTIAVGHGHDHSHGVGEDTSRPRLIAALSLLLVFAAGEVVVGLLAGSVALLTDAGHMVSDAAALALALVAIGLAARPPGGSLTYGLKRAEPASALVNGVTLAVLALVFVVQAVVRLIDPHDFDAVPVLVLALLGIPVNLVATAILAGPDRRSVNVEGAFQHVLTDLYAFIATAVAAVVIIVTGFDRADPIAALLVAALMARASYGLLRDSGRIFMEAAPAGVDVDGG